MGNFGPEIFAFFYKVKRIKKGDFSKLANNSPKSGKRIKQMSIPPFWGDVGVKKWSPFLDSGARSPIFGHLKMPKVPIFRCLQYNLGHDQALAGSRESRDPGICSQPKSRDFQNWNPGIFRDFLLLCFGPLGTLFSPAPIFSSSHFQPYHHLIHWWKGDNTQRQI